MSVPPDELTGTQQAVLLTLMAEARAVRNPELAELGPKLDKPSRDSLVRNRLIDVTPGKPAMTIELTDAGWATCAAIIGADTPDRPSGQGKTLYTILKALRRYVDRHELPLSELFGPADDAPDGPAIAPDPPDGGVEGRVRIAYARLATRPGGWVDLVRLRRELPDVPRGDLDSALSRMYRVPGVSLVPEANQKTLTKDDHDAAVSIGDQAKHLIAIEA